MTTEDLEQDISVAFERLAINSIYEHMMKILACNTDKDFVNTLIDELIKKGEIFNTPPPQGLDSLYINSKSKATNPTENSPINPDTTTNNGDAPTIEPIISLEKEPNSLDVNAPLISDKSNCNFSSHPVNPIKSFDVMILSKTKFLIHFMKTI